MTTPALLMIQECRESSKNYFLLTDKCVKNKANDKDYQVAKIVIAVWIFSSMKQRRFVTNFSTSILFQRCLSYTKIHPRCRKFWSIKIKYHKQILSNRDEIWQQLIWKLYFHVYYTGRYHAYNFAHCHHRSILFILLQANSPCLNSFFFKFGRH